MGDDHSDPITCLLCDDNALLLHALQDVLPGEGISVVGATLTGIEALRSLQRLTASVVVLDVRLPDLSGLEVARRIAEMPHPPGVVFHTSYANATFVADAFDAGARAVVLKDAKTSNLVEAIKQVHAGGIYVDPRLHDRRNGR